MSFFDTLLGLTKASQMPNLPTDVATPGYSDGTLPLPGAMFGTATPVTQQGIQPQLSPPAQLPGLPTGVNPGDTPVPAMPINHPGFFGDGGHFFGPNERGSDFRNLLGRLGDALLVGNGHPAMFMPEQQQLNESDALKDFGTDPMAAIAKLTKVNPAAGMAAYNTWADNQRQMALTAADIRSKNQSYIDAVDKSALGLLGTMNEDNYDAQSAVYQNHYARAGLTPQFKLPAKYDKAQIDALMSGAVSPTDRFKETEEDARGVARNTATVEAAKLTGANAMGRAVYDRTTPQAVAPTPINDPVKIAEKAFAEGTATPGQKALLDKVHPGKTGKAQFRGFAKDGSVIIN